MWCHELRSQADSWRAPAAGGAGGVGAPKELWVDHFWSITNLSPDRYSGVLAPAFSSAARPKSHYRGRRLEAVTQPEEAVVWAQNETLLLLNLLSYEPLCAPGAA